MAEMTFLDLVNRVIDESKIILDPLTTGNFAAPPRTSMYGRIKNWLNTALEELVNDRPDWQFRMERASLDIYPRLYVTVAPGYTPLVGDTITGASSGVTFTITGVHTTEDIESNSGSEYTISVSFTNSSDPTTLIMRETLDKGNGTPFPSAMTLLGWGRYTFDDLIVGLDSIDTSTIRAHYVPTDAALYDASLANNVNPVRFISWDKWSMDYDLYPFTGTPFPQYMAETPQGTYALYPYPDTAIQLTFDYRREFTPMAAYSDKPSGLPEKYHMYLVWRAIQELADFDGNTKLFARAKKHVDKYELYLFRDELPHVEIAGWNGVTHRG